MTTRGSFLLAAAYLLCACAGELKGGEAQYRVTPAQSGCAPEVFQAKCANQYCHDSDAPTGGLDLASPGVADRLVDVAPSDQACASRKLIDTAHPEDSFLLEKVVSSKPECGDPMPLAGDPLTSDELTCVKEWVYQLAGKDGAALPLSDGSTVQGDGGADASTSADASTPPDGGAP